MVCSSEHLTELACLVSRAASEVRAVPCQRQSLFKGSSKDHGRFSSETRQSLVKVSSNGRLLGRKWDLVNEVPPKSHRSLNKSRQFALKTHCNLGRRQRHLGRQRHIIDVRLAIEPLRPRDVALHQVRDVAHIASQHVSLCGARRAEDVGVHLQPPRVDVVQEGGEDLPRGLELVAADEVLLVAVDAVEDEALVGVRDDHPVVGGVVAQLQLPGLHPQAHAGVLHRHLHVDGWVRLHAQHKLVPRLDADVGGGAVKEIAGHVIELDADLRLVLV
mmetsp:Transcript_6531/g.11277  ORF Transcript_6531/g.11277 Transcript_6531/m.11277 type:complete len:274 (-) Transcript_6531:744-1565(-)